jgi:hypothetical protein
MARKKRHTSAEIAAKLQQARELAAQGKLQPEIARAIGVSVMTFHRWRKLSHDQTQPIAGPTAVATARSWSTNEGANRIAQLKLENARLRRLVTDLMLEKMQLEEVYPDNQFVRRSFKR